jgi:membrane dipeptidase
VQPFPVFDAHVDSLQRELDLGHDLGRRTPGQLDLERGRAGGLSALVMVAWCDPSHLPDGAVARTRALLGRFHALARRHPDTIRWAGNGRLLDRARSAGAVAGIPGIEGGHSIDGSLDELRRFFRQGVRVMTLVWNNHLDWVRSCQDGAGPDVPGGLSAFGREVVAEMNRLGMVVDLSHAGDRSFHDALDASERPVIASHSGCRALSDHPRNLTDEQLRRLAAARGVVGVVFHPGFLDPDARAEEARVRATDGYRAIRGENETDTFLRKSEYLEAHAAPYPLDGLVDHVLHAMDVAGSEHVGVGSDFDGIQRGPAGLCDASGYPRLAARLLERGASEDEVRAVMGGNLERVYREVTGPGTEAWTAELEPVESALHA